MPFLNDCCANRGQAGFWLFSRVNRFKTQEEVSVSEMAVRRVTSTGTAPSPHQEETRHLLPKETFPVALGHLCLAYCKRCVLQFPWEKAAGDWAKGGDWQVDLWGLITLCPSPFKATLLPTPVETDASCFSQATMGAHPR